MRFFNFLVQISSLVHFPTNSQNRFGLVTGSANGNGNVHVTRKFLSGDKGPYYDEDKKINYIKKLELENSILNDKFNSQTKLINDLNEDLKRIHSERLLCMIYESYQRLRMQISEDIQSKSGMKIDAYLDAVRKKKVFSDDKLIHWMINFENSKENQLLREFRNGYSHYTVYELPVLREWRSKLIDENCGGSVDNAAINEAAIMILNTVINHLQSKRATVEENTFKFTSKKQLKKLKPSQPDQNNQVNQIKSSNDEFLIYQRNSERIRELRKLHGFNPQKLAEIRKLRLENLKIMKQKGKWNDINKNKRN